MNTQDTSSTLAALSARLDHAETRASAAENRYLRVEKRFRALCAGLLGAITIALSLPFVSPAVAQGYGMTLAQAATRIAALETKTQDISRITDPNTSKTTVRFSAVNVQIVDGTGATEGTQSGLGNLIVGYNERRGESGEVNTRTGNHNLVAGIRNNYSSNGGVVFGYQNTISNVEATVTGGVLNTSSGNNSSVSAGSGNTASGDYSSVSGGRQNTASGNYCSVSGGRNNTASTNIYNHITYSSVSGGFQNTASGNYASISGGQYGSARGDYSCVSGGSNNSASGAWSNVCGGYLNEAFGEQSSILGGQSNLTEGLHSCVSGGLANYAPWTNSSISGGQGLTPPQSGSNGGQNAPWCAGGGAGGNGYYRVPTN